MRHGEAIERLVGIMARLRAPEDGCPWDLRQDLDSLRAYLVEETYEVLEALHEPADHREELGDLLFQIVFQSRIRQEEGHFDLADVANGIADKLERRHPHVFGDQAVTDAAEVARNWHASKAREKKRESALDGVPTGLPALLRAQRIGEKAARQGFDWPDAAGVRAKLDEELAEVAEAQTEEARAAELGDVLFTVANWCRHLGVEPEFALQAATDKFERRFRAMEQAAQAEGAQLKAETPDQLEARWQRAKTT